MPADAIVPVARDLVDDAQGIRPLLHFKEEDALARMIVGAVAGHHQLAREGAEEHRMRAVHIVEHVALLHPGAGDFARETRGVGHGVGAALDEAGPEHDQLPARQAVEIGPVGHAAALADGARPGRVGSAEEDDRITDGFSQVLRQADGADLPVAHLQPLMTEHHPGIALLVHIERAVQAMPAVGGDGLGADGLEGPLGAVRHQTLAAAIGALGAEGADEVILALPDVAFRGPVVQIRPEITFLKADRRLGPVNQILALQDVEISPALGHVGEALGVDELHIGVILAAHGIGENAGIADVHIAHMIGIEVQINLFIACKIHGLHSFLNGDNGG